MEENWNGKGKVNENKIMMREAGLIVLAIILFLQYFKLAAYLSDKYFFDNHFMSYLVLILGIPLSYFATKYLVKVIKKVIKIK
ncbi:hypothetical protein [Ureibacillus acetophenoni]|uniref:Uncharacterized protein n=1 Tax=Ureibacillus acetophenoni TaxID=614649 RepID=A0A285UHX6_9BACL|nr:hypothetical protein [Ureibacillus acetophenoni]SOC41515.1 hypothetical protein SAMN05877842_110126 [Ureibacillus acetophenoni]